MIESVTAWSRCDAGYGHAYYENKVKTPRDVVAAAFSALYQNDWKGIALLCDPLSLASFKVEMLMEFGDQLSEDDLDNPPSEIAPIKLDDEQYEQYMQYLHPDSRMKVEFPMLSTVADLREMDPVEVFACWLKGQAEYPVILDEYPVEPWRSADNSHSSAISTHARSWPHYGIIGCVFDSPTIAHVLYRPEASPLDRYGHSYESWLETAPTELREFLIAMNHRGIPLIISCRRQGDGSWLIVANRRSVFFGRLQVVEILHDPD